MFIYNVAHSKQAAEAAEEEEKVNRLFAIFTRDQVAVSLTQIHMYYYHTCISMPEAASNLIDAKNDDVYHLYTPASSTHLNFFFPQ
jgi:hypothetical protein